MICPKCGTEVYGEFTTKHRIDNLYTVNTSASWAKICLQVLADSAPNMSAQAIIAEVLRIKDGLHTVLEYEKEK